MNLIMNNSDISRSQTHMTCIKPLPGTTIFVDNKVIDNYTIPLDAIRNLVPLHGCANDEIISQGDNLYFSPNIWDKIKEHFEFKEALFPPGFMNDGHYKPPVSISDITNSIFILDSLYKDEPKGEIFIHHRDTTHKFAVHIIEMLGLQERFEYSKEPGGSKKIIYRQNIKA